MIMALLRNDLSESLIQYVLMKVHETILPNLYLPMQMADYLVDCYNYGGITSVLALNGLFILITDYNINYPNYYNKLYQLLTPEAFQLKYRQRFLTLLVQSLRSTAVPATVVAAFMKRLCRIAVTGSPSTAMFVIPLITELITYHHSCYPLLHVADEEDIYDVVGHRKPLPGVDEEEMDMLKKKAEEKEKEKEMEMEVSDDDVDEEEEEDSEEEEEEEEEEVVAETASNEVQATIRSTTVLSSELLKRALERMKMKRAHRKEVLELPAKRVKNTHSYGSRSLWLVENSIWLLLNLLLFIHFPLAYQNINCYG